MYVRIIFWDTNIFLCPWLPSQTRIFCSYSSLKEAWGWVKSTAFYQILLLTFAFKGRSVGVGGRKGEGSQGTWGEAGCLGKYGKSTIPFSLLCVFGGGRPLSLRKTPVTETKFSRTTKEMDFRVRNWVVMQKLGYFFQFWVSELEFISIFRLFFRDKFREEEFMSQDIYKFLHLLFHSSRLFSKRITIIYLIPRKIEDTIFIIHSLALVTIILK